MNFPQSSSLFYRATLQPDRDPNKQLAIEIPDDSLSDVGVRAGFIVIIELSTEILPERLTAVMTPSGDIYVRYVILSQREVILVPANPRYPRIRVSSIEPLGYVHTVISSEQ